MPGTMFGGVPNQQIPGTMFDGASNQQTMPNYEQALQRAEQELRVAVDQVCQRWQSTGRR